MIRKSQHDTRSSGACVCVTGASYAYYNMDLEDLKSPISSGPKPSAPYSKPSVPRSKPSTPRRALTVLPFRSVPPFLSPPNVSRSGGPYKNVLRTVYARRYLDVIRELIDTGIDNNDKDNNMGLIMLHHALMARKSPHVKSDSDSLSLTQ